MTIKDKPKYRAYRPVQATDGLLTWTQHTFDHTVEMTADDEEKLISVLEGIAPEERIKRLQANLDGLQNMTPVIQAHVNEIRAILARLDNHFSFKNRHEADELGRAEILWQKILILRDIAPLARKGQTFTHARQPGTISISTKFIQHVVERNQNSSAKEMLFAAKLESDTYRDCPLDFGSSHVN